MAEWLDADGRAIDNIVFNEVQTANAGQFLDTSWNYGGWVELFNNGTSTADLNNCWISDDPQNLKKIQIIQPTPVKPGGVCVLWFDHFSNIFRHQIDLKLDCDGGTLLLSDITGKELTRLDYPAALVRNSWARMEDGLGEWAWTDMPSPSATNNHSDFASKRLEPPVLSHDSHVFSKSFTLTIDIPDGAILRYTDDGTTPTRTHGMTNTTGSILVTRSRVFRFTLFKNGFLASPVVTRTFIRKDKDFSLPIVSVVTAPENLYSDSIGIFIKGTTKKVGNTDNWDMDWDRPVNFEYLNEEGVSLLSQEADISRSGGLSRTFTPCTFKVTAKKKYEGMNTLNYPFFADKPFLKHKTLVVRGGGNDNLCRMKDACLQSIVRTSGLDVDAQDYQPVCHYINGVYKGTMNLREPSNKHYVYANYGLEEDEIDLFEVNAASAYGQKCGTADAWKKLLKLCEDAADDETYKQITELLDVDEFCNYMAVETYLYNNDWPQNNQKGWRPAMENGKFRFILFDLDLCFGNSDFVPYYGESPFDCFESRQWFTPMGVELVPMFVSLLKNDTFRKHFIDTFCLVAGSVFEPSRCEALILEYASRVYPMQILDDNGYNRNVSPWESANFLISQLGSGRPSQMCRLLRDYPLMGLGDVAPQSLKLSSNIPQARLQVNGQTVPTSRFNGEVFPPVTLTVSAPSGYRFAGWKKLQGFLHTESTTLFAQRSSWKYHDDGSLDGVNWMDDGYAETGWANARAPFGYSDNNAGITTKLGFGANAKNKYPTYYFRKTFTLKEKPGEYDSFLLKYTVDDGFAVYINGEEARRVNLPGGTLSYNSFASNSVGTEPLTGSISLPGNLFREGNNVIAVEVHNVSGASTDIHWDCSLSRVVPVGDEEKGYVCTDESYTMPTVSGTLEVQACYEPVSPHGQGGTQGPLVVINEVSAGNSVYVNEYFKRNDWVELYNITDEDVDLSGAYLSDDLNDPHKYCITDEERRINTTVPSNGFLIVWCDKLESKSQLHAPFKLSNEDNACVLLTAADGSWSDTLVYCRHDGAESVGRFPDGNRSVYRMYRPTIGEQNKMNRYTVAWHSDNTQDGIEEKYISHSGELGIVLRDGMLHVRNEESLGVLLEIFTVGGVNTMTCRLSMDGGRTAVSTSLLAPGTYIAKVTDPTGNSCSIKFKK